MNIRLLPFRKFIKNGNNFSNGNVKNGINRTVINGDNEQVNGIKSYITW